MTTDEVSLGLLQAADVGSMIQLIAEVFSSAEPPAVAMRLTCSELTDFLNMVAEQAIAEGLTIVARSQTLDQVVGALLTDDFALPLSVDLQRISPRFLPIFAMLEGLDQQYREGRDIKKGEYLHLFMLAVDPRFGGQRVAQRLVQCCLENGTRRGFRWAVTEATGVVSQRVFGKLGFNEQVRQRYHDFRYNGEPIFSFIDGHDGTVLMDKSLVR